MGELGGTGREIHSLGRIDRRAKGRAPQDANHDEREQNGAGRLMQRFQSLAQKGPLGKLVTHDLEQADGEDADPDGPMQQDRDVVVGRRALSHCRAPDLLCGRRDCTDAFRSGRGLPNGGWQPPDSFMSATCQVAESG